MTVPVQTVHTQLCARDVSQGSRCLATLLRYCRDPIRSVIHDDGSLGEPEREALGQALPGVTIVSRAEANTRADDALRHHPRCHTFHRENIFGPKLFDVFLWAPGDLAYCDSDIVFMRPFTGLFSWNDANTGAILMRDHVNGVCVRAGEMLANGQLAFPWRCNAGLFYFRRERFDLDYIEWFLGQDIRGLKTGQFLVEQSIWNGLAWRAGCRVWDPRQIVMVSDAYRPDKQFVAGHCASGVGRHRLQELLDAPNRDTEAPFAVRTIAARRVRVPELMLERGLIRLRGMARKYRKPTGK